MSAPTSRPMWENPCGHRTSRSDSADHRSMAEILEPLLIVSKNALLKAQQFSEQWVGKIFQTQIEDHHKDWSKVSSDWLPSKEELPKSFGEQVPREKLEKIMEKPLNHTLNLIHKNMQIYAVGLEQAYLDQETYQDGWAPNFRKMQVENKQVLCELETVLMDLKYEKELVKIERDVLTRSFSNSDQASRRNLRDWFILRDFMTNLEYTIELCEFVIDLEEKMAEN